VDGCFNHVLQYGHVRPEVELLENHAQARPDAINLLGIFKHCLAPAVFPDTNALFSNVYVTGIRNLQQVDTAQKGAFSGTTRPYYRNDVSDPSPERNPLQDLKISEALVDVFKNDGRGCRHFHQMLLSSVASTLSITAPVLQSISPTENGEEGGEDGSLTTYRELLGRAIGLTACLKVQSARLKG
jgi:hypothetical protein